MFKNVVELGETSKRQNAFCTISMGIESAMTSSQSPIMIILALARMKMCMHSTPYLSIAKNPTNAGACFSFNSWGRPSTRASATRCATTAGRTWRWWRGTTPGRPRCWLSWSRIVLPTIHRLVISKLLKFLEVRNQKSSSCEQIKWSIIQAA